MGKINSTLLFFSFLICMSASAEQWKYIVYFKDKPSVSMQQLRGLFSEKALQKQQKYHRSFDIRDFPVNTDYTALLKQHSAEILNVSNWLNAVVINVDAKQSAIIRELPCVASVVKINRQENTTATQGIQGCMDESGTQAYEDQYGSSYPQFHLLNGEYLHEQGFNGENMTIAICDNGFYNANNNTAFSEVFAQNRILGTYDYVHGDSLVYDESAGSHGAYCFSFIAGKKVNQYIGTASKASFYLFHTENNASERLQEEFNLATALERCYQLGVDVVSISLGYTTFDVSTENHDTTDMMKNNTPAAKAVNMAVSKGLLVCVAAGNEGTSSWHYISTPSDADSAFAIASVDINGTPAASSGWGLATDTRVKPNVAAAGQAVRFINTNGTLSTGSGTSFATPSLAGMATCLWQAFPAKTNWEIKTAIEQSASQYLTPDKKIGYGIPDFQKAYNLLATPTYVSEKSLEDEIAVYPNPFQGSVSIVLQGNVFVRKIQVLNNIGQIVYSAIEPEENTLSLHDLSKGMYLLQIETDKGLFIKKIIKD